MQTLYEANINSCLVLYLKNSNESYILVHIYLLDFLCQSVSFK